MGFFKMIKNDNAYLSITLMTIALVVAIGTIFARLTSCEVPVNEPRTDFSFVVEDISFITLKQSKAQVKLKLPSLPEFSKDWDQNPQVYVYWTVRTRGGEEYSGMSIGALTPPYDSFIFSIQNDLEEQLSIVHPEELFVWEYRIRILREVTDLFVDIRHPETNEQMATFHRKYVPEQRREETWAID
jgi:hypothetical protein